jgi:hypothetical protein
MQLQDQKAVSRNDPEHGRFLRLALSEARTRVAIAGLGLATSLRWRSYLSSRKPVADATASTVLAGSRSLNLSNAVAAVVFEAWRQIGVLVAAP